MMRSAPSRENGFWSEHAQLMIGSFARLVGRPLIAGKASPEEQAQRLYEADFAVVSHGVQDDPIFNYGNAKALELFETGWSDFTAMPSRFSAEPVNRDERHRLLQQVTERGFIGDYQGIRISAQGRRFEVRQAVVWNLIDDHGVYRGQAAMLAEWRFLAP